MANLKFLVRVDTIIDVDLLFKQIFYTHKTHAGDNIVLFTLKIRHTILNPNIQLNRTKLNVWVKEKS